MTELQVDGVRDAGRRRGLREAIPLHYWSAEAGADEFLRFLGERGPSNNDHLQVATSDCAKLLENDGIHDRRVKAALYPFSSVFYAKADQAPHDGPPLCDFLLDALVDAVHNERDGSHANWFQDAQIALVPCPHSGTCARQRQRTRVADLDAQGEHRVFGEHLEDVCERKVADVAQIRAELPGGDPLLLVDL